MKRYHKIILVLISSFIPISCHPKIAPDNNADGAKAVIDSTSGFPAYFRTEKLPEPWKSTRTSFNQVQVSIDYQDLFGDEHHIVISPYDFVAQRTLVVDATISQSPLPISYAVGKPSVFEENLARGDYRSVIPPWEAEDKIFGLRAYQLGHGLDYVSMSRLEQCQDADYSNNFNENLPNNFMVCSINRPEKGLYIKFRLSTRFRKFVPFVFYKVDDVFSHITQKRGS